VTSRPGPAGRGLVSNRQSLKWREAIRHAGLIWLAFIIVRWVVLIASEYSRTGHGTLTAGVAGLLEISWNFDASYFLSIAQAGYFTEGGLFMAHAFFPGYPLALRAASGLLTFSPPTQQSLMVAGHLLTAGCALIATILVYRLAEEQFGPRAAALAAALLMAWPTAAFLTVPYSEATYLALAVGAWWCAGRGRWWSAGLLCCAASLTRFNGLFLLVALLVFLVVRISRGEERFAWYKAFAVAIGSLGVLGYFWYLWRHTGDLFAWSHAQWAGWGRATVWPWTSLSNTLQMIFTLGPDEDWRRLQLIIDIGFVVLGLFAVVYLARRRLWPEMTLTLLTFLSLMSSTYYLSIARNTLTVFPLFVVGGAILARRRGWVPVAVLVASATWMLATTALFNVDRWVG
jgi:hypothetical protein